MSDLREAILQVLRTVPLYEDASGGERHILDDEVAVLLDALLPLVSERERLARLDEAQWWAARTPTSFIGPEKQGRLDALGNQDPQQAALESEQASPNVSEADTIHDPNCSLCHGTGMMQGINSWDQPTLMMCRNYNTKRILKPTSLESEQPKP